MKKKQILCLVLIVCALALSACGQQQEVFPNQPKPYEETLPQATEAPAASAESGNSQQVTTEGQQIFDFDSGDYNPASEEDVGEELTATQNAPTPAPTVRGEYAGATPVLIDPIDKPTPTPLPTLKFTYATYTADAMHISFQAPEGWIVETDTADNYVLTYPNTSMDYAARIEIRTVAVNKNYTKNELTKELKGMLDTLQGSGEFSSFDPSQTASRDFIDGNGIYAAYKATRKEDGVGVAGRIIVNCVNKQLYILHCSYPRAMADTFAENVYNKVRRTMKIVQQTQQ